jgi:hypothetical protein
MNIKELQALDKMLGDMNEMLIKGVVDGSWLMTDVATYLNIAMVNTPILRSEVGDALLDKYPKADLAIAFTVFEHKATFFLRSKGDFDVRTIAALFDGDGSKNAAEFTIDSSSANFKKALESALDSGKNIRLDEDQ